MTHKHEIKNCAHSFRINPSDRGIYKTSPNNIILMQGDHNSVRFSFRVPRYINGHDMSLCNKIELNYINISLDKANKTEDVYIVQDMAVDTADEKYILFSWLLSKNATKYAGTLSFLIEFLCVKEDATASYSWHTDKHTLTMTEGMDNEETVVEAVSDVLAVWEAKVIKVVKEACIEDIKAFKKEAAETYATKTEVKEINDKVDKIPTDVAWYAKDVEELLRIEVNPSDFICAENDGAYFWQSYTEDVVPAGLQVIVTYNGKKYAHKIKRIENENFVYVGNLGIEMGTGYAEDTGEPFLILSQGLVISIIAKDAATVTVQLVSDFEQIPEIYLPMDKLATKEEVADLSGAIGDIDTALDELHAYAQNLILGVV